MNIDPKVEPWLRALLEGVENSNHTAEVVATAAYDACRRAVRAGASADAKHEAYLRQKGEMI